jgi:hypothetical protein
VTHVASRPVERWELALIARDEPPDIFSEGAKCARAIFQRRSVESGAVGPARATAHEGPPLAKSGGGARSVFHSRIAIMADFPVRPRKLALISPDGLLHTLVISRGEIGSKEST